MTALPSAPFGHLPDGRDATVFTLQNQHVRVRITDFGGRMVSIETPDRNGNRDHVLLGFDNVAAYADYGGSFGTLLGRFANRIAGGSFSLDGRNWALSRNSGDATLHGGAVGFNRILWQVAMSEATSEAMSEATSEATSEAAPVPRLVLTLVSPDGDQGFPGELRVTATYLLDADTLSLTLAAQTDKPTIVNLSAHPYFNLAGPGAGDVLGHEVIIPAEAFLPTDSAQIPTGEIRSVANTPFDFRQPRLLGSRIRLPDPQLYHGLGYDHCYVLGMDSSAALRHAVRVHEPVSGRVLDIHTDQPGVQVYTGNKLTGTFAGHGGRTYRQSDGLALEPQGFPDAPHHANFPSAVLRPGEHYRRTIQYRFGTT